MERDAAVIMGGDVELSRADRPATPDELATIGRFGPVAAVIAPTVQAKSAAHDAFVDLVSVGPGYPLIGQVASRELPQGQEPFAFLGLQDGYFGALVDPLLLV